MPLLDGQQIQLKFGDCWEEASKIPRMDEEQLANKLRELLRKVEAILSRPDVAGLISAQSGDQVTTILHFIRDWDRHAAYLTHEQKAKTFVQLDTVVSVLSNTIAEYDQTRLQSMPVDQMGKA